MFENSALHLISSPHEEMTYSVSIYAKPNAFCYLNHQTCDSENGIITDVFVTPGNVSDNVPHTARIECQINKFDFHTKAICADAGYDSPEIYTARNLTQN